MIIKTTIFFLVEGLPVLRLSRNQPEPVRKETVKNSSAPKTGDILKIMGKAIFFVKGGGLIKILVKALEVLEALEVGGGTPSFKYL